MNPIFVDEPDPAAHLLEGEELAWSEYRGLLDAEPAARARWAGISAEIERVRTEAGWPRLEKQDE